MFEDLRGFLTHLESLKQLLRVKDEVDVKYEIAAGMRKTSDIEGPALLFENIRGYRGWRVLGGLFATRKLVALGLGVPQEQMLERYLTLEDERIPPEVISDAPCKEIRWTGDQVDLSKLPIVTHAGKDCGPYVTIGVQIGKSPDTGIRNLSVHRMLVLGKDRLSLWAPADHHLGRMILMAEEKKKGLEVATAVGVDPAIVVGSQARVPFGIDEFHIVGALRGAPVKLTKCETIDVEVPAFSEVVIEGVTIPEVRGVNMTPGGTFRHHVVVSIKKRAENEGRNVILALLSMGIGLKQVIVVDDDIDPFDPMQVDWAMATRFQADKDAIVIPRIACSTLDPSCPEPRVTAGLGIDATAPMKERWRFEKVEIPGIDKVKYL